MQITCLLNNIPPISVNKKQLHAITESENCKSLGTYIWNFNYSIPDYIVPSTYSYTQSLQTLWVYFLSLYWTLSLWSHPPGIVCPKLTNPENGRVIQLLDGNVPGTVANYSCDAGYNILGNVARECVSMGLVAVWTGEAPTCQRKWKNVLCTYNTHTFGMEVRPVRENTNNFCHYWKMERL